MVSREEVISELSRKFDPRNISWEFRAILDVIQDEEPVTVKELETAINERYDCVLFTYKQLYDLTQTLVKQNIVKNNPVTKQYSISPEYRTKDIQYLPISTYSIVLFTLSVGYFIMVVAAKKETSPALAVIFVGALYLLAQYIGSEFSPKNGLKQFLPKPFSNGNNGKKANGQKPD